jgi:hypothetical protein
MAFLDRWANIGSSHCARTIPLTGAHGLRTVVDPRNLLAGDRAAQISTRSVPRSSLSSPANKINTRSAAE